MNLSLKNHIQKFVTVSDTEFEQMESYFEEITIKKKETLLEADHVASYNYFVVKGCLRMYFVNDKGVEQTTEFAIENWWLTDLKSFHEQKASNFYIQAVESSTVLRIQKSKQEILLDKQPILEKYFRKVYQKATAASQVRAKFFKQYSREELYFHFSSNYPWFIQRVPQYLIASYLGFTPEYLSEIKKKSFS
ncbi:Crp/Fnr family transcriptional regulator [Sphingobacterium hungaricum]|uniref:Crp/Fnr family transcriptional regulator n=1 Tax=Sphingobacterium hungaricum TaxID=2082723 RepID=A0A928YPW4_9SPHI|nr:Crp/Fnr family transcriptional regulator [Sphingobacterium hungaricum]MBE8712320.1 Crp/Fnr family transcriptional regulator [Sphingobacterium hungaricum]